MFFYYAGMCAGFARFERCKGIITSSSDEEAEIESLKQNAFSRSDSYAAITFNVDE